MGLTTNERGLISPIMKIGDTVSHPNCRPQTSLRRVSYSKRIIDSADFPVSRQRIRTSLSYRQSSQILRRNIKLFNHSDYVDFHKERHSCDGEEESEHFSNIRRRLNSKDIVHHLLEEWVPQLCENYRPFAMYHDKEDTISVITAISEQSDKNSKTSETNRLSNRRTSVDSSKGVGVR